MLKKRNIIVTILFFAAIWMPLADILFSLDPTPPLQEFRVLSSWSDVKASWKSNANYTENFENFFKDNLGFRRFLLQARGIFLVQWLGVTACQQKIIAGKNGWMFNNTKYYTDINPFEESHLKAWQRVFEANRDWLKQKGMAYFIVIAPGKGSIYPEYLPSGFDFYKENIKQYQFANFFRDNSDLNIINLKACLNARKKSFQLYYDTDHHWNDVGGVLAYQTVVKRISRDYPSIGPPLSFEDIVLDHNLMWSPAFARMSGLNNIIRSEKVRVVRKREPLAHFAPLHAPQKYKETAEYHAAQWDNSILATEQRDQSLPSVVVIHDSFGNYLRPFLSEHFKRGFFCERRRYIDKYETAVDIIEREQPDMVIHQIWELHLQWDPVVIAQLM